MSLDEEKQMEQQQRYLKITNKEENHRDFQYHDGLNKLEQKFNNKKNETCVGDRLYFTTLEFLHKFYDYGCYLREIDLPTDDPEFEMLLDPQGDKWAANQLILGTRYPLFDYETFKKFNLRVNEQYLYGVAQFGTVEFLKYLEKHFELKCNKSKLVEACIKGKNLNVFKWLLSKGYTHANDIHLILSNNNHEKDHEMIYTSLCHDRISRKMVDLFDQGTVVHWNYVFERAPQWFRSPGIHTLTLSVPASKWLLSKGINPCADDMEVAFKWQNSAMVEWLKSINCPETPERFGRCNYNFPKICHRCKSAGYSYFDCGSNCSFSKSADPYLVGMLVAGGWIFAMACKLIKK